MTGPVLAAHRWPTNAHLIEDVARLGYLRAGDVTLDPTFGEGVWWKRWSPETLIKHGPELDGVDFRALPEDSGSVDAAAYDPPYVCVGGRSTSGLTEFFARYGLGDAPRTPALLQALINEGLRECTRVVRPGGIILVKCADYVWSGHFWAGTHRTLSWAEWPLQLELVDRFEFIGNVRAQPKRTRKHAACKGAGCDDCVEGRVPSEAQHARRNLSTLFVLRKPTPRRAKK